MSFSTTFGHYLDAISVSYVSYQVNFHESRVMNERLPSPCRDYISTNFRNLFSRNPSVQNPKVAIVLVLNAALSIYSLLYPKPGTYCQGLHDWEAVQQR